MFEKRYPELVCNLFFLICDEYNNNTSHIAGYADKTKAKKP